jgi:glutathione S-transferase
LTDEAPGLDNSPVVDRVESKATRTGCVSTHVMAKLYIANKNYSSWSLRPWLLLKQLGITFEEVLVPFGGNVNTRVFAGFSPTGRVPCLVDGDLTVWDSLAITEYLAETHPGIWPKDRAARTWARCASAEMHSAFHAIRNTCTMNCGLRVKLFTASTALRAEWGRIDQLWNEGLDRYGGSFLAGDRFTAVDAFFAPIAFRVQTYAPQLSPVALRYSNRLLALPAMMQWYDAALKEVWRDEPHEAEAREAGEWLQDLRSKG